jgi:hypothetical protein
MVLVHYGKLHLALIKSPVGLLQMWVQDQQVANWGQTYMAPFWSENQLIWTQQNRAQRRELMIWRTKMQARIQGWIKLEDSICFQWDQIVSLFFWPWTPSKVGLSPIPRPAIQKSSLIFLQGTHKEKNLPQGSAERSKAESNSLHNQQGWLIWSY